MVCSYISIGMDFLYPEGGSTMKLSNVKDVKTFIDAIDACQNDVYLKSPEGDVFNLKSSLSQYIAVGRLLEESGDSLELYALTAEDDARLHQMLDALSD